MFQVLPILAILASLATLVLVLELMRRAQLRVQYALLWLLGSAIILVVSILWKTSATLAKSIGIENAPWPMLLVIGLFLALVIQGFLTIAVSRLAENNRDLTQRIAILEWYVRQLRKQVQPRASTPADQALALSQKSTSMPEVEEQAIEEAIHDEEKIGEGI